MAQIGMMKPGDGSNLYVVSFNMHGFNTSQDYLLILMQKYDILLLQEHMLRKNDIHLLTECGVGFKSIVFPAMHDGGVGRPAGGIANFVRNFIRIVEDFSCSINNRVNALLLDVLGKKIIIFNVYLPCFSNSVDYDVDVEICCHFIYNVIRSLNVQYDGIIIAGDFNCNIGRKVESMENSHFCRLLRDLEMRSVIKSYNGFMKYTFISEANDSFSMLDDIWINCGYNNIFGVQHIDILDDEDNFSDHCPVACTLSIKSVINNYNHKVNDY
jgi:exonuclease III